MKVIPKILLNRIHAARLFDCYGTLLTASEQQYFQNYFFHDQSVCEIASHKTVSRSAAYDSLTNSLKKMTAWEKKIGLLQQKTTMQNLVEKWKKATISQEEFMAAVSKLFCIK